MRSLLLLLMCAPVGLLRRPRLLRPLPAAGPKQLPQPWRRRRQPRLMVVVLGRRARPVTCMSGRFCCFCHRFRMAETRAAGGQAPRQLLPAARLPGAVLL